MLCGSDNHFLKLPGVFLASQFFYDVHIGLMIG